MRRQASIGCGSTNKTNSRKGQNAKGQNVRSVDSIILTQSSLGIFPSGLYPCRLWRHWGTGWVNFTLAISGLIRGRHDILPGKVLSESMGVAIPVRHLGRGTASSSWLKSDFYSLRDDGWN
jgi:hypothetical protein